MTGIALNTTPLLALPFDTLVLWWMALAGVVFIVLLFIAAPYGRHSWLSWPSLPGKVGWLVMEAPSAVMMAWWFLHGSHLNDAAAWVFIGMWELHYVQRTFIFPLRMKGRVRPMPLFTALMAMAFNVTNAWFVGRWLFILSPTYGAAWLLDPRFLVGAAIFLFGYVTNIRSDTILLNLRKPGESGYKIPIGGFYRWVSCPNYMGELVEWLGFALATWSLPALAFAVWTAANLVPRALTNHKWYRKQFADYPPERRAVVPYLL